MRIRSWHRGMSCRFILFLRRHQVIGKYAGLYKGAPGDAVKCSKMRGDARCYQKFGSDTRRYEEMQGDTSLATGTVV